MVRVQVDTQIRDFQRVFDQLRPEQINQAAARAINRTLLKGRTEARKAVKVEYNIPQKNLDGIKAKNAFPSFLEGYITASAIPIPMDAFAPKFETASGSITISRRGVQRTRDFKRSKKNAATGVSIEVKKGERRTVPFAFMIRGAKPRVFARGRYQGSGNYGFILRHKRTGKGGNDTPIKPLISVTVYGAVINDKVEQRIADVINTDFGSNMERQINYLISRAGGSG